MKRSLVYLTLFLMCGMLLSCAQESRHEYLVDIIVKNEEQLPVESLSLGTVANGEENEITDALPGEENEFHFAVSYNPECEFVLSGKAAGMEVQNYYFHLKKDASPKEAQQYTFYMQKSGDDIVIKESAG